ncbi:MAG: hypothetical protein ABIO43_02980 [Sphingomicrobium sp.]
MMDEIFDRNYQSGREALNRGIDRGLQTFVARIRRSFETLNRIQWNAPWKEQTHPRRRTKRAGTA